MTLPVKTPHTHVHVGGPFGGEETSHDTAGSAMAPSATANLQSPILNVLVEEPSEDGETLPDIPATVTLLDLTSGQLIRGNPGYRYHHF